MRVTPQEVLRRIDEGERKISIKILSRDWEYIKSESPDSLINVLKIAYFVKRYKYLTKDEIDTDNSDSEDSMVLAKYVFLRKAGFSAQFSNSNKHKDITKVIELIRAIQK